MGKLLVFMLGAIAGWFVVGFMVALFGTTATWVNIVGAVLGGVIFLGGYVEASEKTELRKRQLRELRDRQGHNKPE
jgi:membrane associated rhomboid family serine protease